MGDPGKVGNSTSHYNPSKQYKDQHGTTGNDRTVRIECNYGYEIAAEVTNQYISCEEFGWDPSGLVDCELG